MSGNIIRVASAVSAAALSLCLFGCDGGSSTIKSDSTEDESSTYSSSSSNYSSSHDDYGSSSSTPLNYGKRDDGMTYSDRDEDGYSYFEYDDGSAEITDGYGNVGRDSDGDGELDSFSFDGGETWEEL